MINQTQLTRPEKCDQGQGAGATYLECVTPEFLPFFAPGVSHTTISTASAGRQYCAISLLILPVALLFGGGIFLENK